MNVIMNEKKVLINKSIEINKNNNKALKTLNVLHMRLNIYILQISIYSDLYME